MSLTEVISKIEQLSTDDIKSLEEYLQKRKESNGVLYKVRDGWVNANQQIWWLSEGGPVACTAGDSSHTGNVRVYPTSYSIKEPSYRIVYDDVYEE